VLAFGRTDPQTGVRALCASTLETAGGGAAWTTAAPLWNHPCDESFPVTAVDGVGNALVLCSYVITPGVEDQLWAAYRPSGSGAWQLQQLDSMAAGAAPDAAFDRAGNAFVVWRRSDTPAPDPTRVVARRRTAADGTWSPLEYISGAGADTRYPRVSVLGNGEATALFQSNAGGVFQVRASHYRRGAWGDVASVQWDNANEGRFAVTLRQPPGNTFVGRMTVWRETDPASPTPSRYRIMAARRSQ
jgi:hypothetical protein